MPSIHALSPSMTMSADADHSDTDFDIDFSSSDDEAGVFFGTPKAVEHKIVAALSKSIPATPLTRERPSVPRRSSSRLQKRDSREFLRRKTLLISTPGAGPSGEKMWEGGFHERADELEDEPVAGPSTPTVHQEDIAVDLDTLRLDTFPSSSEDDASNDYFDEEEEDKENTAIPEEWDGEEGYNSEDEYVPAPPESVPMTIGFRIDQYDMDLSPQLDMGGLSLLDIDDPEAVPLEYGNDTGGAGLRISLGASTSSARSSDASIASASRACRLQPNTPSPIRQPRLFDVIVARDDQAQEEDEPELKEKGVAESLDCHYDTRVVEEASKDESLIEEAAEEFGVLIAAAPDASPSRTQATPDLGPSDAADDSMSSPDALTDEAEVNSSPDAPRAPSPFESLDMFSTFAEATSPATKTPTFLDTTADLIAFTPLKPNGPSDAETVNPDLSYVSDMDSPKGRAPVMIPVFTVASPPKRSIPMRSFEPMLVDDLALFDGDTDTAVALPTLDSPFGFRYSPFSRPPAATTTPSKSPSKLPVLSPAQTAKAQKTLARRAAAKEQLESLFSSKLGKSHVGGSSFKAAMPQLERPLATSSRVISKAPIQSPEVSTKSKQEPREPLTLSPEVSSKGKGKAPEKPLKSILKSTSKVTQPKPFALSAPRQKIPAKRPASGQSALPRPAPAAASSLPRPVAKRPASAAPTSTEPAPGKLFRITPKVPASRSAEAAGSLKRPYAATQSSVVRAAVPAGINAVPSSRPTLGMPSRPVRDQAPGTSLLSPSISGSGLVGALSKPPVKSPGKMLSPSKPVLGKPYRRTGMTPVASRTMATPQRGLPTPSKAFKLGTPSRPGATPLKPRARMAAVSEERRLSCTPIRGEEPPTPPKWLNQRMDVDEPPARAEPVVEPPVLDMPAHAEARVMASPLANMANLPHASAAPGTTSLSPEGGKEKGSSPPSEDKEATPPYYENSEPPNSPEPSVENAPPSDSPPQPAEEAQESAQAPEADPPGTRRSMRARTPRSSQTSQENSPKKPKAPPAESIVPGMTERALKTATTRNTARNQVYLCTIDRQIVRKTGERPPSPTIGTRTLAERDAEDQKAGRSARAKRRARESMGESETDGEADNEGPPVERAVLGRRAPGDDEEYKTPVRPAKRAKIKNGSTSSNSDEERNNKRVRWDEGLLIIRRGLGEVQHTRRSPPARSCVTPRARYQLDEHGNAVNRPTEKLKRTTITVNATFYDGEEPVAFDYNKSASGKRKGKK